MWFYRCYVFCGDRMLYILGGRETEGEAQTLLMQSDEVGNLTAAKIYWLSLRRQLSSINEAHYVTFLYVIYLMTCCGKL